MDICEEVGGSSDEMSALLFFFEEEAAGWDAVFEWEGVDAEEFVLHEEFVFFDGGGFEAYVEVIFTASEKKRHGGGDVVTDVGCSVYKNIRFPSEQSVGRDKSGQSEAVIAV